MMAMVAVSVSGCAAFSNTAPPPAAAVSVAVDVPGRGAYIGVHWVATQVWRDGVTRAVPAAMAVTVDFSESGSVIFSDGVNVVDARWAPLAGESVRLQGVSSSAAGYVGHDAGQLAAILAVRQLTSPFGAGDPATSDITVTRAGDVLTLTRVGVRISYRTSGPTSPELVQSAAATTSLPSQSPTFPPAASSSRVSNSTGTIPYDLLTHCGIREALIQERYYVARPALDDGNGNPPKGWDNPYDSGTMAINADHTADFLDAAGNRAHFVLRPAATTWLYSCA